MRTSISNRPETESSPRSTLSIPKWEDRTKTRDLQSNFLGRTAVWRFLFISFLICLGDAKGQDKPVSGANLPSQAASIWNLDSLSEPPLTYPADDMASPGVKAIFYEGLPFQGKPTRVFAWYGIPKLKPGQKAPAMVLVHGGGATAFADWVRLWVSRGYAAIAMDLCGSTPTLGADIARRHEWAGPPGWGGFGQMDWPQTDQWCYHAVADILLANSLIRSMPEVDPERVGITGISWGGYLTCIAAAIDHRFKFAVPVYGCGFLLDDTGFTDDVKLLGPENAVQWMTWWDPSSYLSQVTMPMLWVDGSNDTSYPLNALQKSYRLPSGLRTLAICCPKGPGCTIST